MSAIRLRVAVTVGVLLLTLCAGAPPSTKTARIKAAKALGLTLPQSLLRADEITQ